MTSRVKKLIGWLVGVFVIFPLAVSILVTVFASSEETGSSNSISDPASSQGCIKASPEDIKNLSDGLVNKSLSINNAFKSDFSQEDIDQIKAVFPSYTSPRIVAALIEGIGEDSNVALWGIQEYDYGWRILALNGAAKQYSNHGVDIDNDSASGRVRSKILELSPNTNAEQCAKSKQ